MATLYGHGKGKAKSHPPKPTKPYWIKLENKEVENLIVNLAKKGLTADKIGLILRDTYGIPKVKTLVNKKISKILEEHGIERQKLDLENLKKKEERIKKHLEKNKLDKCAKRGLQLTQSKIHRLKKYYHLE